MCRQYCFSRRSFSAARSAYWHTAWRMSCSCVTRWPNDQLTMICCFAGSVSIEIHGVPFSSRTVRSSTTPNVLRINAWLLSASCSAVVLPIAASFLVNWRPHTQISLAGNNAISRHCLSRFVRSTTPPVAGQVLRHDWQGSLSGQYRSRM